MPTTRQRRVRELLVQEISVILQRELKDPRIGFVTITDAEVTPDLRTARVYFSVLGDQTVRDETHQTLNRAAGFVRAEFARRAQLRYVPVIQFHFDPSVERGAYMSQLIAQARLADNAGQEESSADAADSDAADSDTPVAVATAVGADGAAEAAMPGCEGHPERE